MDKKMINIDVFIKVLIIVFIFLGVFSLLQACSGNVDKSDSHHCKYCGVDTNWAYRDGYICYYCDKKHKE